MKNLWILILVIVVIALGIWGYKYFKKSYPASTSSSATSTPTASTSNAISVKNFAFNPAQTTVTKGTEVTFTNNDSVTHNITFDSFNSGNLVPGTTYKHTFDADGAFNYHCSIHPTMKGIITVQ